MKCNYGGLLKARDAPETKRLEARHVTVRFNSPRSEGEITSAIGVCQDTELSHEG